MVKLVPKGYRGHCKSIPNTAFFDYEFCSGINIVHQNAVRISITKLVLRSILFSLKFIRDSLGGSTAQVLRSAVFETADSWQLTYSKTVGTGLKCNAAGILGDAAKAKIFLKETGAHFHAQAHIST
jgi:hypothetical protein